MNLDPLCWTRTTTILLLTKRVTPIYIEDNCVVQAGSAKYRDKNQPKRKK